MMTLRRDGMWILLCLGLFWNVSALAAPSPCQDGVLPSGALSRVCVPSGWNGELLVWAHGYTAVNQPLGFQNLTLPDGSSLPDLVQSLGFAFATTSYRQNGLAILEGVEDIRELVAAVPAVVGRAPSHSYLAGASEGGLVTALLMERSPTLFSGGLSTCGPIGDFQRQIGYMGDFRVLFDYFFPGVIPGSAIDIPQQVMDQWDTQYVPAISAAMRSDPQALLQLLRVSGAAFDARYPDSMLNTAINLLWYNVFGSNDLRIKLAGNPYDNVGRRYAGSFNDVALNAKVQRFGADASALKAVQAYQTNGKLARPMITLHTLGDEVIPFGHEVLYAQKVAQAGGRNFLPLPVKRYGHCMFSAQEALASFALLKLWTQLLP